jgi:hypothetical protein
LANFDLGIDRLATCRLRLESLKHKAARQPLFTTSGRDLLANAEEKQEPAKKLMRFSLVSKQPLD